MRPEESFIGQPVKSLQTMLRVIGRAEHRDVTAIPDGIYSRQTAAAVANFQRSHGLHPTGISDRETWDEVVVAYEEAEPLVGSAQAVQVTMPQCCCYQDGDKGPWIMLAQCMFYILSGHYCFCTKPTISGIMDAETSGCCREFQKLCALPETGNLDRITWKHLSLQFSLAACGNKT